MAAKNPGVLMNQLKQMQGAPNFGPFGGGGGGGGGGGAVALGAGGNSGAIMQGLAIVGQRATKPCSFYPLGLCKNGDACRFSHEEGGFEQPQFEQQDAGLGFQLAQPAGQGPGSVACRFFMQGRCTKGDTCNFSHDVELATDAGNAGFVGNPLAGMNSGFQANPMGGGLRSVPCKFFMQGRCNKGDACTFSHEDDGSGAMMQEQMMAGGGPEMAVMQFMGGKGMGKGMMDKGKGKGKLGGHNGGKGHLLPRTLVTEELITGVVQEWKSKHGWIVPECIIEHEKSHKHGGKIFVSINDIGDQTALVAGSSVCFKLFEDQSGLVAMEVMSM